MLPLRAYLIVKGSSNNWNVTVHRDLDSIVTAWASTYKNDKLTGVIHVGFTRSDTSEFENLINLFLRECAELKRKPVVKWG